MARAGLVAAAAALLLPLGLPPGAAAQGGAALELTMEQAIVLALENSRAAVGVRLARDAGKRALAAAEERYRPDAGAIGVGTGRDRATRLSVGPSLRVPTGGTFRLTWSKPVAGPGGRASTVSLTFSQPLLKGFGPDIDTAPLRMARMRDRIDVLAFRDGVAGVVGSAISAYRNVLQARERVTIARTALERARRQLEINRALVGAGRMAPQDLVQTEGSVADREYALGDSEDALESAIASFVNTLDLEEGARIALAEEPAIRPERPDLEESLETAFDRRADWLSARLGVDFARMALVGARDNLLPDLSLNATTSRTGGDDSEIDWSWALNLTVPLWDDGPKRALAAAKDGLRRAEMALAERRQRIRIEVRRAVRGVAVTLRRIELAGKSRALAERKLEIERLKLRQGLSSSFLVSRSEDDLVNAQRQELDAVVGYRNALDALDRALGKTLDRWGIGVEQVGR